MPNTDPSKNIEQMGNRQVRERVDWLVHMGAKEVDPAVTVAGFGQAEVIVEDERFFITPNDGSYARYVDVMTKAEIPFVENSPHLGDHDVVVGRIKRNARSIPQILRSKQPRGGEVIYGVFSRIGSELGEIAKTSGVVPAMGRIPLRQMLVLPAEAGKVLFTPPVEFSQAAANFEEELVVGMANELSPEFDRQSDLNLLRAFAEGLYDSTSR